MSNKDKQTIFINNQNFIVMKQTEKNSSKQVNNETLNVETLKSQLKAACVNMNAKETKEYIKTLDGYELRLTGQKPTQHYTVFFGELRICNVEQVQGIKADGSSRGCITKKAIKTLHAVLESHMNFLREKFINELTKEEQTASEEQFLTLVDNCDKIDTIFEAANERAAAKAKEAAKEAAKIKKVEKITETMTLEQMMKQAELLAAAIEKAKAAN